MEGHWELVPEPGCFPQGALGQLPALSMGLPRWYSHQHDSSAFSSFQRRPVPGSPVRGSGLSLMQLLGNQKPALKIKLNDRVLGSVVNRCVGCSGVPPTPPQEPSRVCSWLLACSQVVEQERPEVADGDGARGSGQISCCPTRDSVGAEGNLPSSRPATCGLFSVAQRDTRLLSGHWLALPCQPSSHLALHKLNC